jgi:hypothetical protein
MLAMTKAAEIAIAAYVVKTTYSALSGNNRNNTVASDFVTISSPRYEVAKIPAKVAFTCSTGVFVASAYILAFLAKYLPCEVHNNPPAIPPIEQAKRNVI